MSKPDIAQKEPYAFEVEEGKPYFWCACGKSANQPLCDGSHSYTDIRPQRYVAEKSETLYFCGCKQTKTPPLCDGSHNDL